MNFQFATATKIMFGPGRLDEIARIVVPYGQRVFIVTRQKIEEAAPVVQRLEAAGIDTTVFPVDQEPSIDIVSAGVDLLKQADSQVVISFGGGSTIDTGKAIAAMATNPGSPLDYLEVVGLGKSLTHQPLPFVAIPTTAGTGAEVTKNAVLAVPEHKVKVSLRSDAMLANVALVDPELTYSAPPSVTATTGMDALTQVIEPYVSHLANPMTDAIAHEGIRRGAHAIRRVYQNGQDAEAREAMALTSLFGGLALANAKLGAVHGFAGPLGGMYHAPHGAICAVLLPPVMQINVAALEARAPDHPSLARYVEVARLLTGDPNASVADGVTWARQLRDDLNIPGLETYGVQHDHFADIISKASRSSSMKGNPITLTEDELGTILEGAM